MVNWAETFASHWLMLFLFGAFAVYFLMPLPIFNYKGRLYILKAIYWSAFAPCLGVIYPVIWLTDQFVSLATPISDVVYAGCFYT